MFKFQTWQFDGKPALIFMIAFLNDRNTLEITFTFLVVTCLDYHFVQSDFVHVGSGFVRA